MHSLKTLSLFCLLSLAVVANADQNPLHSYKPEAGFVPNEETAKRIAVAVWEPIYGKAKIEAEKPYRAVLRDGIWTVSGSLPPNMLGGVAIIEIEKDSGKILRVSHGK